MFRANGFRDRASRVNPDAKQQFNQFQHKCLLLENLGGNACMPAEGNQPHGVARQIPFSDEQGIPRTLLISMAVGKRKIRGALDINEL